MDTGEWGFYEPRDADAVREHHAAQERRIGRQMDLPDLMEKPVLISLVRRAGDRITHVVYVEAEAEVCALGEEPIPAEEWEKVGEAIAVLLRKRGIRIARAFVPEALLEVTKGERRKPSPLSGLLKRVGLKRDRGMAQFFRWLI